MRLLFVASDPMEFRGIVSHVSEAQPLTLGIDWARAGRIGKHEAVFATNGIGWKRAAAAVDAAANYRMPEAIVSTGFCGALEEELDIAAIVTATAIQGAGGSWKAAPVISAMPHQSGVVCSIDRIARTAEHKAELRKSGGCAVEMEAAGVAERAELLGVPFFCVRSVTDLSGETMANDFDSALRPDGHFATMLILRGALRQPTVRLPELWRLRNRCARAARGLGDFIVNCKF